MKIHLIDLELFFREDESYAAVAHVRFVRVDKQEKRSTSAVCLGKLTYMDLETWLSPKPAERNRQQDTTRTSLLGGRNWFRETGSKEARLYRCGLIR